MKLLLLDRPVDKSILEDREVEFFGPWAQPMHLPEDLIKPTFEPYSTPESVYEASIKTMSTAQTLLAQLKDVVPSVTGVNRNERFWKVFLGHHVVVLAGIVQDIIVRHQALPEKDYVLGLAHDVDYIKEHVPYSWNDAQELLFSNDCFRWYAMGLYLEDCYSNHESVKYSEIPRRRIAKRADELRTTISQNGLGWLFKKVMPILLGHGRLQSKEEQMRDNTCSLVWDRYHLDDFDFKKLGATVLTEEFLPDINSLPSFHVDKEKREKIENSLSKPYGELLSLSLPVIAVEGLAYLVNLIAAEKRHWFKKIERVYTHGQGFSNEGSKRIWLALLADDGKKIVSIQHGGGATYFAHSTMFLEKIIADGYISWGPGYSNFSDLPNANKTKILPSIYLTHLKQKSLIDKKEKWEILFVVLEENRYTIWLRNSLFPDMAHDYFTRQKVLFDYFCARRQTAVKVYPETYGWGQAEWIKAKYPAADLLASGRFVNYALQSRIVIVDYSSTAFLELLAMGRPFLATWNRRWFKGNGLFEEFIDKLIDVGIFYEQPEALIKSYAEIISPDITLWWNESKRQDVLREMANNFAMTSDETNKEWSEEFQKNLLY